MKLTLFLAVVLAACSADTVTTTQQLCTQNPNGPCCPGSPIIIDLAGDGIHLSSAKDGIVFKLRPGQLGQWAWPVQDSDDAFLVLDRNGDGRINDGSELFGDGSLQVASRSPNGFMALAYFDWPANGGNGDGRIDANDAVWSQLRLWQDAYRDGFADYGELLGLDASGVHGFALTVEPSDKVDEHGNEFRFAAMIIADPPVSRIASDVWLRQALPTQRDYTEWTCEAWGYSWTIDPPKVFCTNADTYAQPVVSINVPGWGVMSLRQVVKFSTNTSKSTAALNASSQVQTALVPWCEIAPFPVTDPLEPGPYYIPGAYPNTPRVKCTSHVVHTGGGGGGC